MEYKVLALGDVASETGLQLLEKKLRAFKKEHDVRFTVVNGENISGSGLTKLFHDLLRAQGAIFRRMASYCSGSAGAQGRVSPPPAVNCPTPTVLPSAKPFFR